MNPKTRAVLLALASTAGAPLMAQPAAQTAPSTAPTPEQVVELNPFEVQADPDNSYGAVNSNSITRFKTELFKLPVSADVFTDAFMKDIGATDVESTIQGYSGAAGISAVDAANVGSQAGDHVAHNYLKLNGFNTAAMQRDSLMPVGPLFNPGNTAPGISSTFDVERIEVIMGPQALLYSGGGPGGVVNIVSKQAHFGTPVTGDVLFKMDQYGTKYGELDTQVGTKRFALRVAVLDDALDTRRVNVGYRVQGLYGQLAFKPVENTTVRFTAETSTEHAVLGDPNLALGTLSGDARAGASINYLLATNQAGGDTINPTTGKPNTAGALLNGNLNWGDVDSLAGSLADEITRTRFYNLNVQTNWTPDISSEIALGYSDSVYNFRSGTATLFEPTATVNPTGNWATGTSPSETDEPAHNRGLRASVVDHAVLDDGKISTQTIVGGDFVDSRAYSIAYSYWQADANFNPVYVAPILNSTGTSNNNGRTKLPTQYFSLGNGIVNYPLFPLGAPRVTFNGVNYVRMPTNQRNPTLVSPSNPLGTTSATGLNEYNIVNNKGYFMENLTEWGQDKKLTTLLGARLNDGFDSLIYVPPQAYRVTTENAFDFDAGANYQLLSWLAPYVNVSNVSTLPSGMFPDPAGKLPTAGKGIGEELGFKFHNNDGRFSGSLSYFHSHGTNELFSSTTLENAISPSGLNGRGNASSYFELNHTTDGVNLTLTANPVENWRLRLSAGWQDGRLTNSGAYPVLYNDQFYANKSGQVTYADGTLVYVNANAFSSKTPIVAATSTGATPLTIAMMNDPSSLYYANPVNPTGAINSSSAVATVLAVSDPTHGPILTGAVGLPISQLQITPAFGVPTTVQAFHQGDHSLGTPQLHVVLTSLYTISSGWAKGFKFGGTVNGAYQTVGYYYLVSGFTTANPQRKAFYLPNSTTLNPIIGYEHHLGKLLWSTQLNINNLFNHYDVVVLPSQATGYTTVANLTASFFGQPRTWVWTNTVKF